MFSLYCPKPMEILHGPTYTAISITSKAPLVLPRLGGSRGTPGAPGHEPGSAGAGAEMSRDEPRAVPGSHGFLA